MFLLIKFHRLDVYWFSFEKANFLFLALSISFNKNKIINTSLMFIPNDLNSKKILVPRLFGKIVCYRLNNDYFKLVVKLVSTRYKVTSS